MSPDPGRVKKFYGRVRHRQKPGQIEDVEFEAADVQEAVKGLQAKGYIIIQIGEKKAEKKGFVETFFSQMFVPSSANRSREAATLQLQAKTSEKRQFRAGLFPFLTGVGSQDLMLFAVQLASLLEAGVPLVRSLKIIERGTKNKAFFHILIDVQEYVAQGFSLHAALSQFPRIFPDIWLSLVEAGEMSGNLVGVLKELVHYQEAANRIKGKLISAFFYPGILMIAAIGAVSFLLIKIIPQFEEMFRSMHMALPLITRVVVAISVILRKFSLVLAGLLITGTAGIQFYAKTPQGRYVLTRLCMRIPILGTLILQISIVRFSRALKSLICSGLPILPSLKISSRISQNAVIQSVMVGVCEAVEAGHNFGPQMEATRVFPYFMTQLVSVGEETGQVDGFLQIIADYYEERINHVIARLSAVLEPILLILVGCVVGVIVVSLFLPLAELSTRGVA